MSSIAMDDTLAELGQQYLQDPEARWTPDRLYELLYESDGIHPIGGGMWLAAKHSAVEAVLRDKRFLREPSSYQELAFLDDDPSPEVRYAGECHHAMTLMLDPPRHTRIRNIEKAPFLPSGVKRWEEFTEQVVGETAQSLPRGVDFDLKRNFSMPIPERVICLILGVPMEDHRLWEAWGEALVRRGHDAHPAGVDGEAMSPMQKAHVDFANYFANMVEQRRGHQGPDLLTELVNADAEGGMSDAELIGNFMLLVVAGHETTGNAITSAMSLLLADREQWMAVVDDPSLVKGAVEESLRLRGAKRFTIPRLASTDIEFGQTTVPAGDKVIAILEAANRDPSVFEDPLGFDITRSLHGKTLASFGSGAHFCLGVHLARMEINWAIGELARRWPTIELAMRPDEYRITEMPTVWGLEELLVRIP